MTRQEVTKRAYEDTLNRYGLAHNQIGPASPQMESIETAIRAHRATDPRNPNPEPSILNTPET